MLVVSFVKRFLHTSSPPERKNQIITARAITSPGGVFANTVLINAGKDYGIKIGQPAISSLGLVGYVINVSMKTSRILLIIDINSMIPIYFTSSNWPAVVKGQSGEYRDNFEPERFIKDPIDIQHCEESIKLNFQFFQIFY